MCNPHNPIFIYISIIHPYVGIFHISIVVLFTHKNEPWGRPLPLCRFAASVHGKSSAREDPESLLPYDKLPSFMGNSTIIYI